MQKIPCPFCSSQEQEIYDLFYDEPHILVYCKCGAQAGEAEDKEGAIAYGSAGSNRIVQLLQVIESATKDENYAMALRVANNAIKQFPDLTEAYFYRAIVLSNLGNQKDARLDFEQAKKLYLSQLKDAKISAQGRSEARMKLKTVEQKLKLFKS